jgi:hypothetical protein
MTENYVPFRTVMRGYEPGEVDRRFAELAQAHSGAEARVADLLRQVSELSALLERRPDLRTGAERSFPIVEEDEHRIYDRNLRWATSRYLEYRGVTFGFFLLQILYPNFK